MTTTHHRDILVVGAGLIGLSTAILLARDGHRVTVVDRDAQPPPATTANACTDWKRPGVNQFQYPHLMLPRWRQEMERELPDVIQDLLTHGAARFNTLHLQSDQVTHGWRPGDEQYDTVTARRPVLELALHRKACTEPNLTMRRGVKVVGLLASTTSATPLVRGIRTTAGDIQADLVIDAAGRRTPIPGWIGVLGKAAPLQAREECGFRYDARLYRSNAGRLPRENSVATHHPSLSVLTLPADLDTYYVVLVTSARDRALRVLRHDSGWGAAVAWSPVAERWVAQGTCIARLRPLAGLADVCRSYLRDGEPVVTGLIAVGDAAATTNPSLGRGAAIGMLQACALRDALAAVDVEDSANVTRLNAALTTERVKPWVDATLRFDRHRIAEMHADIAGTLYVTGDAGWAMTTALLAGANQDPLLARAHSRIAGMLQLPHEVMSDANIQRRLAPFVGGPRYPLDGPTRDGLLWALAPQDGATPPVSQQRRPVHA